MAEPGPFYEQKMGFRVDWVYEDYLAGISKDAARLFLRRKTEQEESKTIMCLSG